MRRRSRIATTRGGCQRCSDKWRGSNAHMLAARHHQATGHTTWSHTEGRDKRWHGGTDDKQERLI